MAEGKLFELADQLKDLTEQKNTLQADLKELNKKLEDVNGALAREMLDAELQNFQRGDRTFYLRTDLQVSDIAEMREALYQTLRDQGFGDLIKETVNPQTLKAFVKEQVADTEDDELPEWIAPYVRAYKQEKVGIRKA